MENWVRRIIRILSGKEIPLCCQKERKPKQNLSTVSQNSDILRGSLKSLNTILAITVSPVVLGFDSLSPWRLGFYLIVFILIYILFN